MPLKSPHLVVALVQIESLFDGILEKTWGNHGHTFVPTEKSEDKYKDRITRLHGLLHQILNAKHRPDVILLPEYAFINNDKSISPKGQDTLQHLENLSESSGTIIVGNYYDTQSRSSNTFVLIPSSRLNASETTTPQLIVARKITRSRYESDTLAELSPHDEEIIRIHWATSEDPGRLAYLQILTCKDFLYFTSVAPLRNYPEVIRLDMPGIIMCPIASPEVHSFETRALAMSRDLDLSNGDLSVITCLANCSSLSPNPSVQMCGQTQILSPIDIKTQIKPIIKKGLEGCIIASINPFQSQRKPTPVNTKTSGSVLENASVFSLQNDPFGNVTLSELSERTRPTSHIVNPDFLAFLGLRRVYGFIRCSDYHSFKNDAIQRSADLPDHTIGLHGIYGIHDLLASSWEDFKDESFAKSFLEMRLWPMLSKNNSQNGQNHFGYCIVKRFWKHRGIPYDDNYPAPRTSEEMRTIEYRENLRRYLSGETIEPRLLKEMIKANVLIPTEFGISDLSVKESNSSKVEYLVFIKILSSDTGPHANNEHRQFQQTLLKSLISDDRVRTVEEITPEGHAYVDADYIIHVVGSLADLNDIVLGIIHDPTFQDEQVYHFKCGTRVVIPAESISSESYPSLIEANKHPSSEPNIIKLVEHWKKERGTSPELRFQMKPAVIYRLDDENARKILQSYFLADEICDKIGLRHRVPNTWMSSFFLFSYEISSLIANKDSPDTIDYDWKTPCHGFVSNLAKAIEGQITRVVTACSTRLSLKTEHLEAFLNLSCQSIMGNEGRFRVEKPELGSFAIVLEKSIAVITKEKEKTKFLALNKSLNLRIDESAIVLMIANLSTLVDSWKLRDISRELQSFSAIRNDMTHHRDEGDTTAEKVLDGVFFGLRTLERMLKLQY